MVTGSEVQGHVFEALRQSRLAGLISGAVYRNGYRPRDSRLEDAVVTFTTGTAGQRQSGVVTVNIYVPDVDPYGNGVTVCDGARCSELERETAGWVGTLTADRSRYLFSLMQTIYTEYDIETHQHFIVAVLKYEYI